MPTRRRRHLFLIPLAAASALALAACGGNAATDPESIDWEAEPTGALSPWGFENADDVGQARLDHAQEQLPDLQIEIDQTAFDAQKFTTRVAGGNVPDVVQMDRRFVPTYAAQDLILPLDECFSVHDVEPDERWYESVVDDVRYDDQVWGVPQFFQPPAILVNNRVLEGAGLTLDDIDTSDPDRLLAAVEAMYEEDGGTPTRLGFDPVATGQQGLWILGTGGQLVDDEGVPTLDDASNVAGIELLQRISEAQGGFAKVKSFSDSFDAFGDQNQYVADQVGAQINNQWYPNVLGATAEQIDIRAVPFRDEEGEPFAVASGQAFVIPAGAENPAAACAWMNELTTTDAWLAAGEARAATIQEEGGINTGLFTGSPEADQQIREQYVTESGDEGFDQVISTYYDVVEYGETFASSPAGQEIQAELNNAITAALLGDKTPEEALADAQDAAMRAYDTVTAGQG